MLPLGFGTTWRDNLSDASFRGAKFKVLTSETSIGRRIRSDVMTSHNIVHTDEQRRQRHVSASRVVGTNPLSAFEIRGGGDRAARQTPSRVVSRTTVVEQYAHIVMDLGREPETFQLEGYVIQNTENNFDYFRERDALIEALNTYGPGLLTHPFYGELDVHLAEPAEVSESFAEGGIARFKMKFVESGSINLENILPEYMYRIDSLADLLSELGLDTLASAVSGVMDAVALAGAAVEALEKIQQGINAIKGAISSAIATATGLVAGILSMIDTVLDSPCEMLRMIKEATQAFKNIVGLAGEVVSGGIVGGCSGQTQSNKENYVLDGTSIPEDMGVSVTTGLVEVTDYEDDNFGEATTSTDGTIAQVIISNTLKFFIFIVVIQISIRIEFTNKDALLDFIEKITDFIDAFLDELGSQSADVKNDDIFVYMSLLRNEFVSSMYGKGKDLTKLTTYVIPQDAPPVLVIAYNLYEDIYRDQEIIDLNPLVITHPGFPPPGETLQVSEF
jgi:prophage DNA circulation protein